MYEPCLLVEVCCTDHNIKHHSIGSLHYPTTLIEKEELPFRERMNFDLRSYEQQLRSFSATYDQFKGPGITSNISSSSSSSITSATTIPTTPNPPFTAPTNGGITSTNTGFTATNNTNNDLDRALAASSRALSLAANKRSVQSIRFSTIATNSNFQVPAVSHSTPPQSPQLIGVQAASRFSTSRSTSITGLPSSSSITNSPRHHHQTTIHSSPLLSHDLAFSLDGSSKRVDPRHLHRQDETARCFMENVSLRETREALNLKVIELNESKSENTIMKASLSESHMEISLLRKQLQQALEMNREMRQQLTEYEESATKKALETVDQNLQMWKRGLEAQEICI